MLARYLFLLVGFFSASVPISAWAETYDIDTATGYRMERYRAPVPESVPGGITVDTAAVMNAQQNDNWVLIDVYPPKGLGPDPLDGHWIISESRDSMAGATWLPEVGRGHLERDAVDYFQRNLEALTGGDKSRGIVFYCTADCWQSWNASVRAISWGYTGVRWYPLGTDGWQEEGGTVEPVEPINFFEQAQSADESENKNREGGAANNEFDSNTNTASVTDSNTFPPTGDIYLIDQSGDELAIGTVEFAALNDASDSYTVNVNVESEAFSDQFLSMRPFDCIAAAAEWYCYLPYPYELPRTVTKDDLTELEYQLLFIWKSPKDFGIDAWNGVYYQLNWQDDGSLAGELLQGDLNVLAEPPEPNSHPINMDEFIKEGSASRRYPSLVIRL